jgi:hypothetical protein
MRRKIATAMALATVSALMASSAAFAQPTHPFCGSGEEYAQEHVVGLAQNRQIMAPEAGGVHNPGLAHQGFRVCEPPPGD